MYVKRMAAKFQVRQELGKCFFDSVYSELMQFLFDCSQVIERRLVQRLVRIGE